MWYCLKLYDQFNSLISILPRSNNPKERNDIWKISEKQKYYCPWCWRLWRCQLVKILPTISEVISIRLRWTAARLMFRQRIFMTALMLHLKKSIQNSSCPKNRRWAFASLTVFMTWSLLISMPKMIWTGCRQKWKSCKVPWISRSMVRSKLWKIRHSSRTNITNLK